MHFITFIQTELTPNQSDPVSNELIIRFQKEINFPVTSDIETIAKHLYLTLNHTETTAFQKLIMFWKFAENKYKQPTDPNLLNQINYIIELQDGIK